MISSAEKQLNKKSAKFNYLSNDGSYENLAKYDKLNAFQSKCKSNYQQSKHQNHLGLEINKQNSESFKFKDQNANIKRFSSPNYQERINQKYGLISFGKNRSNNQNQNNSVEKINKNDQSCINSVKPKLQNFYTQKTKTYGSIASKRPSLQHNNQKIKKPTQFSPYQEEVRTNQILNKCLLDSELDLQKAFKQQENLLIYELEEQQIIVRKQLKQFQYQNQLLRQKIQCLEAENCTLRELSEKNLISFQEKQSYYQKQVHSLNLDIKELSEQLQIWDLQIQQQKNQIINSNNAINGLQKEVNFLVTENENIKIHLNSRDQIIKQLKAKLKLTKNQDYFFGQTLVNKRRKSLDLSTKVFKSTGNYCFYDSKTSKKFSRQELSQKIDNQKSTSIGKLMSKTFNPSYISSNESKIISIDKQMNFVGSVCSMFSKVTNRQPKDLKDVWKWLKMITHQYQSFAIFYNLNDEIADVLDYLQNIRLSKPCRKNQLNLEKCTQIIKKLTVLITDKKV